MRQVSLCLIIRNTSCTIIGKHSTKLNETDNYFAKWLSGNVDRIYGLFSRAFWSTTAETSRVQIYTWWESGYRQADYPSRKVNYIGTESLNSVLTRESSKTKNLLGVTRRFNVKDGRRARISYVRTVRVLDPIRAGQLRRFDKDVVMSRRHVDDI